MRNFEEDSKKALEIVTSKATQAYVMNLIKIENMSGMEMPRIDVELETDEAKWRVVVTKAAQ